ncbi:dedicator of cytokinesis protein [Entamoeba nuttalli P19]|uniref:Dedicator of cytokinesis protein n=1 Tax=Entamoeba nuttalli (strain P19) TaxID=1076696 RepID=K2GI31_ENTNP|nr:dedicator of cytokinesis protein [Entamoeba nuttalli P19]EKE42436.1 dedicator of cytokinesis protein [Entamoeba nuttalli P19]|eukprot:XP_008855229.1 dedicator of cytokinesis protein [Entamoeba nuttalli P19]
MEVDLEHLLDSQFNRMKEYEEEYNTLCVRIDKIETQREGMSKIIIGIISDETKEIVSEIRCIEIPESIILNNNEHEYEKKSLCIFCINEEVKNKGLFINKYNIESIGIIPMNEIICGRTKIDTIPIRNVSSKQNTIKEVIEEEEIKQVKCQIEIFVGGSDNELISFEHHEVGTIQQYNDEQYIIFVKKIEGIKKIKHGIIEIESDRNMKINKEETKKIKTTIESNQVMIMFKTNKENKIIHLLFNNKGEEYKGVINLTMTQCNKEERIIMGYKKEKRICIVYLVVGNCTQKVNCFEIVKSNENELNKLSNCQYKNNGYEIVLFFLSQTLITNDIINIHKLAFIISKLTSISFLLSQKIISHVIATIIQKNEWKIDLFIQIITKYIEKLQTNSHFSLDPERYIIGIGFFINMTLLALDQEDLTKYDESNIQQTLISLINTLIVFKRHCNEYQCFRGVSYQIGRLINKTNTLINEGEVQQNSPQFELSESFNQFINNQEFYKGIFSIKTQNEVISKKFLHYWKYILESLKGMKRTNYTIIFLFYNKGFVNGMNNNIKEMCIKEYLKESMNILEWQNKGEEWEHIIFYCCFLMMIQNNKIMKNEEEEEKMAYTMKFILKRYQQIGRDINMVEGIRNIIFQGTEIDVDRMIMKEKIKETRTIRDRERKKIEINKNYNQPYKTEKEKKEEENQNEIKEEIIEETEGNVGPSMKMTKLLKEIYIENGKIIIQEVSNVLKENKERIEIKEKYIDIMVNLLFYVPMTNDYLSNLFNGIDKILINQNIDYLKVKIFSFPLIRNIIKMMNDKEITIREKCYTYYKRIIEIDYKYHKTLSITSYYSITAITELQLKESILLEETLETEIENKQEKCLYENDMNKLVFQIKEILSVSHELIKMDKYKTDMNLIQEKYVQIAKKYQKYPRLYYTWIDKLVQTQERCGNYIEAGISMNKIIEIIWYCIKPINQEIIEINKIPFHIKINENEIEIDGNDREYPFNESGFERSINKSIEYFTEGKMYEYSIKMNEILIEYYKYKEEMNKVSKCYLKMAELYKMKNDKSLMYIGEYYFVKFIGIEWGELENKEYIYRSELRIGDAITQMTKSLGVTVNGSITIIDQNKDIKELPSDTSFIQIGTVKKLEEKDKTNTFISEIPIIKTKDKKNITIKDIWKKKLIITTEDSLPSELIRQKIIHIEEYLCTPIECCIDDVMNKKKQLISQINISTKRNNPTTTLLSLLQGSLIPQVNGGIIEYFEMIKSTNFNKEHREQLLKEISSFLDLCNEGLHLHETMLNKKYLQLHLKMKDGLHSLYSILNSLTITV